MTRFCNHLVAHWFLLAGLAGCGGGGGGASSPAINVAGGVYSTTANGDETFTVLAPESQVIAPTPNWFGIQFTSGVPDLYSARVTGVGTSSVSGTATTKHFQGISSPRTGQSASMSMALSTRLSSTVSIDATGQENALTLNWLTDEPSSTQYTYRASAPALTGTWAGNWYFGVNVSSAKSLVLSNGAVSAGQNLNANCNLENTQLTPLNGINLYGVSLNISVNTNCTLSTSNTQATPYQGLAFVISNPTSSVTSRLYIMATGQDGQAVFFRGDQ